MARNALPARSDCWQSSRSSRWYCLTSSAPTPWRRNFSCSKGRAKLYRVNSRSTEWILETSRDQILCLTSIYDQTHPFYVTVLAPKKTPSASDHILSMWNDTRRYAGIRSQIGRPCKILILSVQGGGVDKKDIIYVWTIQCMGIPPTKQKTFKVSLGLGSTWMMRRSWNGSYPMCWSSVIATERMLSSLSVSGRAFSCSNLKLSISTSSGKGLVLYFFWYWSSQLIFKTVSQLPYKHL